MSPLRDVRDFRPPSQGVVLLIGNFDGVHRGHRGLLRLARGFADPHDRPVVVLTFEPHPMRILRPEQAPPRLTMALERAALLRAGGVDTVIALATDRTLLGLSAEQFVEQYVLPCRPRQIVEGPTFRFGRGRSGSAETLVRLLGPHDCAVHVAEEAHTEEGLPINSTAVRAALRDGAVEQAADLLGRVYRITGRVGHGEGRGSPLGFPTANLADVTHLPPGHGVYAGVAQTEAGGWYPAAINVGPQPTFAGGQSRIEAHLLDFDGDLRGQTLGLYFARCLRGQVRFESVEALQAQLREDVAATRGLPALDELLPAADRLALT